MKNWKLSLIVLSCAVMPLAAWAQTGLEADVRQLREDVRVLQNQIYRGQIDGDPTANSGTVQQRLSQMEETVRQISGRMDELEHQFKQVDERFKVLNQDIDVRFKLLEGKKIEAKGLGTEAKSKKFDAPVAANPAKSLSGDSVSGEELAPLELPKKEAPKPAAKLSVDELYKKAMDAYNASDYAAAETSFNLILKDYPKEKLAGNAQYWLGEVSYQRKDYAKAAVAFGKAYKDYKNGNKGADSLYKLGMSMQQLDKKAEACAAYQSLPSEFPKAEKALLEKAAAAAKKLCK